MIFKGSEIGLGEILFDVENHKGIRKMFKGEARRCTIDDLAAILEFEDLVDKSISNPELFQGRSREDLIDMFQHGDDVIAVFNKGLMIGLLIYLRPRACEENLALDAKLSEADVLKTAVIHVIASHPEYRGLGIQRYLIRYADKLGKDCNASYNTATVSPLNPHSLQNFLDKDYVVVQQKMKYNNKLRLIVLKKLV